MRADLRSQLSLDKAEAETRIKHQHLLAGWRRGAVAEARLEDLPLWRAANVTAMHREAARQIGHWWPIWIGGALSDLPTADPGDVTAQAEYVVLAGWASGARPRNRRARTRK